MRRKVQRAYVASLDASSGLYDCWTAGARLTEEIARAQRYRYPISVLLVSFFADGLRAEERALQLAKVLQSHVRAADVLARYDRNALLLLLPYTDSQGARQLGERIYELATVMQPPTGLLGGPTPVRVGVATVPDSYSDEGRALVEKVARDLAQSQPSGSGVVVVPVSGANGSEEAGPWTNASS